ncbi:UbiA family prenyltransferase [Marimonas arenosa]|uniref:UbiA family prenyltransferase n=1 Tax=Marimonas arenosa TaxID=1795305 RepID=A0AAE3WIV6_9RHOB|nr:UbiA family prenyltransferase [Marimonas arenosa]MDQ2092278.1 UbiA family prenyltransferase [Marimonas arenosa]
MQHHKLSQEPDQVAVTGPLVLDVEKALLRTDLRYERFWSAFGRDPFAAFSAVAGNIQSPARRARALSEIAAITIDRLPVRESVLTLAHAALAKGRPVHLVSGLDQASVDALALRLDLPGPHFGSGPDQDLTGAGKAAFLVKRFGAGGFDYAGRVTNNDHAWEHARNVIAIAPPARQHGKLLNLGKPTEIISEKWHLLTLVRELRPHQWVKNLLLFVPLLAAHQFTPAAVLQVLLAVMAFSLGASSTYVLNDLFDLDADRHHPEKRHRPIASGMLPIPVAVMASATLAALALTLALAVGPPVAGLTLIYMLGSLGYSLWLKKRRWLDVVALACLFLLRVVAGAVAAGVQIPPILLALGFTVFFVLACVKRITALSRLQVHGHLPGRGYRPSDLLKLEWAAYVSIIVTAAIFIAYSFGFEAGDLYEKRAVLSFAVVPLVVWLYRIVQLSIQGREDYDPVSFVLRDGTGLAIAASGIALIVLAI